ncbi:MAG TPA: hypothetical protein VHD89_05855, partial [Rhodanobacteraceae bacterium]|nr:hypothetical protein [Rhodanobacteraceae bacterium]
KPVHVDGALNDGDMTYNPSIAANGDIWFSAHRKGCVNRSRAARARYRPLTRAAAHSKGGCR